MSNVHRLRITGRIFFVTVNLRRPLSHFTEAEYPLILGVIAQSRERLGFAFCGYVLMPYHWHALIEPSAPVTISRILQDIKYVSSRRLNRLRGTRGTLWQHQFWDRFVRHEKEFGHRLEYMHNNPVRKGLVGRPEDWRWSSYRNFSLSEAERTGCPIGIDYMDFQSNYRA